MDLASSVLKELKKPLLKQFMGKTFAFCQKSVKLFSRLTFFVYGMYADMCVHMYGCMYLYVIVITQDEYDILVITQVRGKAEDEC